MAKTYKIFPGIGIARLGNSESEYFIGPEAPGIVSPTPLTENRDQFPHGKSSLWRL